MFSMTNTYSNYDYITDNNSVIYTIAYNDCGAGTAEAEYNRRTQESF